MSIPPDILNALWGLVGAVVGWLGKWLHGKLGGGSVR